ncbi:MAG: FKBP-type peptidyl-prolyl cis-trans isomerase [Planctomycetota bacterium]
MLAAILAALSFSAVSCGPKLTTGPGVVDPDAPTEFTTTESGLKYRILRKGKGDYPTASSQVVVDYAGTLEDGTTFDTSYNHSEPATFGLRSVVPGWTEGMQLVREGGMIELQIPPDLAYGEEGSPPIIPPNATLMFRVELLDIL